jgi:pyridoxamine 5'-phosphate oxidase
MRLRKSINNLRREYKLNKLSEETVQKNPFKQFELWFRNVIKLDLPEQNAMVLATISKNTKPTARVVLLKGFGKLGFKFFTNYNSNKGKNLKENSSASLLFYWGVLERQVRIEGKIKKLSKTESKKYFDTRPIASRLAAWASEQSKIIPDREFLELRFKILEKKFSGKKIPLPPNWGGYILVPNYFEFWQGRENRLHDRICYKKQKTKWKIFRLAP